MMLLTISILACFFACLIFAAIKHYGIAFVLAICTMMLIDIYTHFGGLTQ